LADSIRHWLFGLEAAGITLGLANIRALLAGLAHPEHAYTSVIVAGTNGKGSVTAMVERGLRAAGRRTGRYTSPHLTNIEERVAIAGDAIGTEAFDHAAGLVRRAAEALAAPPTYFEATTAVALTAFREARVEIAVLEVGLGGRLDATNAVDAPLAVITNVGRDHQDYLGHTIELIAREKAGVIKPGASVVAGRTGDAALAVLSAAARLAQASLVYAPDEVVATATVTARGSRLALRTPARDYGELRLSLPGRHQVDNAVTAVRTLEAAHDRGLATIDPPAVRTALSDVRWPGRLDWRTWRGRDILIDGAHNIDGARALAAFLGEQVRTPVPIVFGIMRDKAIAEILAELSPVASLFVCTASASARAIAPPDLATIAADIAPQVPRLTAETARDALALASQQNGPIVVAGSLFLAGEILAAVA